MSMDDIMKLTFPQFNVRLTDIFTIHGQFNSEKGKGRTKKKSFKEQQEMLKKKGIKPPKFGLVKE